MKILCIAEQGLYYIGRDSNGHQEINGYQFTENRIESSSMPRWETNGVFFLR